MPQLGIYHDDAIYAVTAKSLAEGGGYRIGSLPEQPHQTKYPPLWPAVLAVVWHLAPQFPANLPWMAVAAWIWLPCCAWLILLVLRDEGFSEWEAAGLASFCVLNPAMAMAGTLLLSDLLCFALMLVSLLLARRGRPLAGGGAAGAAYLARTAAMPLLLVAPLAWHRGWVLSVTMLPFVAAWQWWAAVHAAAPDPLTLFYTSYLGYWRADVAAMGLANMACANLGAFVEAMGGKLATAAAVAGMVRLWRRGRMRPYAMFGALYTAQLLAWNYPPNGRFVLPLLPLAAAGIWTETRNLADNIAASWRKGERVAAGAVGVALAAFGVLTLWTPLDGLLRELPTAYAQHARIQEQNRPAREWLARNSDQAARVLSYGDPVLYLHTRRRGYSLRVPPGVQRAGQAEMARYFDRLPEMLWSHGIDYSFLSISDYHFDSQDVAWPLYRAVVERSGQEGMRTGSGAVYRIRMQPGTATLKGGYLYGNDKAW